MKQPALGIVATVLIMAVSLGVISLFDFPTFGSWVIFVMASIIPMEIVIGVTWGANPGFVSSQPQPLKGILLVLVNIVVGVIVGGICHAVVGGGIAPPIPILVLFGIVSVVVTFWMAIMFGGWPFTSLIKSPVGAGLAMLAAVYIINYLLFRLFFDFSFMAGAPWYRASLDPHGMFNGVNAQVFYVTALTFLFVMLHFDLWPFTSSPAVMKQPVLGIVWTLLALVLGSVAYYIGVNTMGMDPMIFLTSGPIPFIFGTIVVLNRPFIRCASSSAMASQRRRPEPRGRALGHRSVPCQDVWRARSTSDRQPKANDRPPTISRSGWRRRCSA